jgi:hypothetical protein
VLTRRAEFSPQDWAIVEQAHAKAELDYIADTRVRRWINPAECDQEAVFFVLKVFEVVVTVALARATEEQWFGDELRQATALVLDELILTAHLEKQQAPFCSQELFTREVHRQLRGFGFWTELQRAITAAPTPSLGKQLNRYRRQCGWSFARLAQALELDESTVKDHVADRKRPRPETLQSYARAFSAALNLPRPLSFE